MSTSNDQSAQLEGSPRNSDNRVRVSVSRPTYRPAHFIRRALDSLLAQGYLHLHSQVDQENWVGEFSKYDAGWLHFFKSQNEGELRRANWDDLNYPARLATLAVAGLPCCKAITRVQLLPRSRWSTS